MIYLEVKYKQTHEGLWDARITNDNDTKVRDVSVSNAKSLDHARVILDILLYEEYKKDYKVLVEITEYYHYKELPWL